MKRWFISAAAILAFAVVLVAADAARAEQLELFEDVETGQIFTRPGKNRVLLEPAQAEAVKAVMPAIYQDPETGAIFSKPAEGRIPMASSARPAVESPQAVDEDAIAAKAAEKVSEKMASQIPAWVKTINLYGDLRLRYDLQETEGKEMNHRGRYRARINLDAPINDWFKVAFMLASGGSDPRSENQTFGPSFQSPDLRLKHAYAEFTPADWFMLRGGQMENVVWRPTDGIWDKDTKPTGGGIAAKYKNETMAEPFMNAALYVIQQNSDSPNDPYMYVFQPGVKLKLSKNVDLKLAGAYYGFEGVKDSSLSDMAGSNTTYMIGSTKFLTYDYDGLVASAELGIKELPLVKTASLFGEYAYNFDPSVLNEGYIVGLKVGDKKVDKWGAWQLAYNWRRMGRDAILDILPDSDAFSGKTNITGHELIFAYGLTKHVEFGLDYYRLRDITTNIDENRFQADFVFNFGN